EAPTDRLHHVRHDACRQRIGAHNGGSDCGASNPTEGRTMMTRAFILIVTSAALLGFAPAPFPRAPRTPADDLTNADGAWEVVSARPSSLPPQAPGTPRRPSSPAAARRWAVALLSSSGGCGWVTG